MNKPLIVTSALALSLASFTAEARTSTTSEYRGYSKCVAAADAQSQGLVPARSYYINRGETDLYYVNATRWESGERAAVRIACETALRGNQLLSSNIESGHYSIDRAGSVTIDIAQN